MSDSSGKPWLDCSNAPQIPYRVYFMEKADFAGMFLGGIFYGIVIALYVKCMGGFLHPANGRTRAVKWGLVVHVTVMFALVTMCSGIYINYHLISYINGRQFPGANGLIPPGPLGYSVLTRWDGMRFVPPLLFLLNQCLADGFLLYRCYIICSMNNRVIIFPCLVYLASMATGAACVYNDSQVGLSSSPSVLLTFSSYDIICVSLNILLTFMIVVRLVLHRRNIQSAMGASSEANRLYKSIIGMLVESCALYAGCFLLYTVTWCLNTTESFLSLTFQPILGQTEVIAPFLIILRVANRTAVTSDSISSGNPDSIHFRSQEQSTDNGETVPDENPVGSPGMSGEAPGEVGGAVENIVEDVPFEGSSLS